MTDSDLENVYRPRLASKADAKRVLRLCAEVPESWKGFNTSAGFILEEDYRRAKAIFEGVLDPEPGAPKRLDWRLIEELTRKEAKTQTNRKAIRAAVKVKYEQKTGRPMSADSGDFKRRLREWLGLKKGSN